MLYARCLYLNCRNEVPCSHAANVSESTWRYWHKRDCHVNAGGNGDQYDGDRSGYHGDTYTDIAAAAHEEEEEDDDDNDDDDDDEAGSELDGAGKT